MTFELGSLTVRFWEEDKDLWEVIQSFPKDQLTIFIKKVLVQHLKEEPEYQLLKSSLDEPRNPAKLLIQSDWNLDALFVASEMETKVLQKEMNFRDQKELLQPGVNRNPLRHLFEIIGEEEDEDVIQFLKATEILPSSPQMDEVPSKEYQVNSVENVYSHKSTDSDMNNWVEPLQQLAIVKSNGLNFILQHVIGEEEDQEVLQFFGNSRKDESNNHKGPRPE